MKRTPEQGGDIVRVSLEAYVAGVLTGEQAIGALPVDAVDAILQVQAVISRTFAVANVGRHAREGYDFCSTTHCQVYRPLALSSDRETLVNRAVRATAGRVVAFEGMPINALFHANCGGATSAPQDLWGGTVRPYLVSRPDPPCAVDPRAAWRWRVKKADLRHALNADPVTRVGTRLGGISVLDKDGAGRVTKLALLGGLSPMVRGEEFRRVLLAAFGARSLQSSRFTFTSRADEYVFEGRGLGHGAGLCQAGALARLRGGATITEVLAYYYPGAEVRSLDSLARR